MRLNQNSGMAHQALLIVSTNISACLNKIIRTRIGSHQWVISSSAGFIKHSVIFRAPHRDATSTFAAGILPLRVEEILLRVLIGTQGDYVQHLGLRDFLDTCSGCFKIRKPEVMPQKRDG